MTLVLRGRVTIFPVVSVNYQFINEKGYVIVSYSIYWSSGPDVFVIHSRSYLGEKGRLFFLYMY